MFVASGQSDCSIVHLDQCPVLLQVSSVELERVVIASVPAVLEAAAVALTPPGGGPEQLVMFLVLDKNPHTATPPVQAASTDNLSHAPNPDQISSSPTLTRAASIAASAVQAVQSAAAPLLAQAQSVTAPATAKLQAAGASLASVATGAAAPAARQAQAMAGALAADVADAAAPTTAYEAASSSAVTTVQSAAPLYKQTQAAAVDLAGQSRDAGNAAVQSAAPLLDKAQARVAGVAQQGKEAGLAAQQAVSTSSATAAHRTKSATAPAAEAAASHVRVAASAASHSIGTAYNSTDSVAGQLSSLPMAPVISQIASTVAAVRDQAAQAGTIAVKAARGAAGSVTARVTSPGDATEEVATTGKSWADEAGAAAKEGVAHASDQKGNQVKAAGEHAKQAVSTTLAAAPHTQDVHSVEHAGDASSSVEDQQARTTKPAGQHTEEAVAGARQSGQAAQPVSRKEASSSSVPDGHDLEQLKAACQKAIRTNLNPLFKLQRVLLRDALPRTASNKVMRRVLRDELRQVQAKL